MEGPLWGWLLVGAVAAGRGSVRVFEGLLVRVLLTLVIGFDCVGGLCFLPVAMVLGFVGQLGQLFPISFNIHQN